MGILDSFRNYQNKKHLSHLKNLLIVALADGKIDSTEMALLEDVALRLGLTKKEIDEVKTSPESYEFSPPSSHEHKIRQLIEIVHLMLVDREIDQREVKLCKDLAIKLNINPLIVDNIIEEIIKGVLQNRTDDELLKEIITKENK